MQKFLNKIGLQKLLKRGKGGQEKAGQVAQEKRGSYNIAPANTRNWGLASRLEHIRNRGKK